MWSPLRWPTTLPNEARHDRRPGLRRSRLPRQSGVEDAASRSVAQRIDPLHRLSRQSVLHADPRRVDDRSPPRPQRRLPHQCRPHHAASRRTNHRPPVRQQRLHHRHGRQHRSQHGPAARKTRVARSRRQHHPDFHDRQRHRKRRQVRRPRVGSHAGLQRRHARQKIIDLRRWPTRAVFHPLAGWRTDRRSRHRYPGGAYRRVADARGVV